MNKKMFLRASTFTLTTAIMAPTQLLAQGERALEQIIVTATKRAESIQDVPVSVSALTGENMDSLGITDMGQIAEYIPNFEFSSVGILPNLYVRGIGTGAAHSIEQSVGRFVDDVYIGRAAINLHSFMDIASVEVLRGPQGTLFGKNTIGGAMIVHTGEPTDEFSMGIDATVTDYSTVGGGTQLQGYVSGPLSENVNARLAFISKENDGYIQNNLNGPDGEDRDETGARLKLEWHASDTTTVGLKLEYMDYQSQGQLFSETINAIVPGGPNAGQSNLPFLQSFDPDFSYDTDWVASYNCGTDVKACPSREQISKNVTFNISTDIGDYGTLDLITAYQSYDYLNFFLAPETGLVEPYGTVQATRAEKYEGFTQEIRFTSEVFDNYDYIIGAYYEDSSLARDQRTRFDRYSLVGFPTPAADLPANPFFFAEREDWAQDTTSFAIFGQFKYNFSDTVSAVFGGRWGTEDKDFRLESATVAHGADPSLVTDTSYQDSRSESKFTPSFTLSWDQSDDIMLFATVSQGHKTGGFSDRPVDGVEFSDQDLEFSAELNTNFEVGMKGLWLDGTLEANISLYHMQIEDLQVAKIDVNSTSLDFVLKNAAEATSQGLELDARWLFADDWTLGGSFAYTDATYDDFPDANSTCPEAGGFLQGDSCNYEGLPLIFAPETKGGVYIEYFADNVIAGWNLTARADANYSDDFFLEINYEEFHHQESFTTINANVRLMSPDEHYSVSLIGKNLTEEYIKAFGITNAATSFVAPKAPREIALKFSYNF